MIRSAAFAVLRRLDAERAHRLAIRALRAGLAGSDAAPDDPRLAVQAFGLGFANPVGLAAGFDKDAEAVAPLLRLGFGFVEAGTVTPRPQAGNPRPRLFRLPESGAVINRMGFNNRGMTAFTQRLAALGPRGISSHRAPVGANIGINKNDADPERDYPVMAAAVAPFADYITINISSPNTPGLRDLQGEARLRAILRAVARAVPRRPPLLVKIAPDLSEYGLHAIVDRCIEESVDGLIVSNTTVARPPELRGRYAGEAGGLSGRPLFAPSTAMLAAAYRRAAGRLALIGCGGISSGADVLAKIEAGASLVQLYSAFAYAGPALVPRLKTELLAALDARGYARVADAVGVRA